MPRIFQVLTAGIFLGSLAISQETAIRIHVQVVVVEPGGKTGIRKLAFSKQSKPGQGKELKLLVSADRTCAVSAAAFTNDGRLAYGVPASVDVDAETKELPLGDKWRWDGHEHLAEIDVIAADPIAADYAPYKELVTKMERGESTDAIRRLQVGEMRRWIDAHLKSPTTGWNYSIKEQPAEVAGSVRGEPVGQEVSIPARGSKVIRLRFSQ
jgi:hypothetical protein